MSDVNVAVSFCAQEAPIDPVFVFVTIAVEAVVAYDYVTDSASELT